MIRMYCDCPNCGEEMYELEDEWFLCRNCNKDWDYEELIELGFNPKYPGGIKK